MATVKAHAFEDVLLCDSDSIPKMNAKDEDSVQWHRRDQFLLSWMPSSIAETMLGHVSRCTHACDVWKVFENLFRSQSKARAMNLIFQLQTLKKGNLLIDEYMVQMRTLADGLQAAGQEITDDDLVLHVLGGLGPEFDVVVVNLTTRSAVPALEEVHSILHTHEMRVAQANTVNNINLNSGN